MQLLSAALAKSGPLVFPTEKRKGSKIVKLSSNSLFSRRQKPKMIFGQYTRMDSDRKCPARNNIAHRILSCYKLQGAFDWLTDKLWKLQLKYFSYKRDQRRAFSSTFICKSKFTYLCERNLKMQALIELKKHISV